MLIVMKTMCIILGVVVLWFVQPVLAQDTPGHGADDMASESADLLNSMKDKPHGLLLDSYQSAALGLDQRRLPNALGLFPVVDHPVHLDPLFPHIELGKPIADVLGALRKTYTDPISLNFQPMAAWTFQHASKTAGGGGGLTKSILWEAISSELTSNASSR